MSYTKPASTRISSPLLTYRATALFGGVLGAPFFYQKKTGIGALFIVAWTVVLTLYSQGTLNLSFLMKLIGVGLLINILWCNIPLIIKIINNRRAKTLNQIVEDPFGPSLALTIASGALLYFVVPLFNVAG